MPEDINLPPMPRGEVLHFGHTSPSMEAYARAAVLADRAERQQWLPIETAPRDRSSVVLRGRSGQIADGYWLQAAYNGNGAWIWPYVHSEPVMWIPIPADAQRAKEE